MRLTPRRSVALALLVLATSSACTHVPAATTEPVQPPGGVPTEVPMGYPGDQVPVQDHKTLSVAELMAGTSCVAGDLQPLALLDPLPLPDDVHPAQLPERLAPLQGIVQVDDTPEAVQIATSIALSGADLQATADQLRQRRMPIIIDWAPQMLADQTDGDLYVLGQYVQGRGIVVDARTATPDFQKPGAGPGQVVDHEIGHLADDVAAPDAPDENDPDADPLQAGVGDNFSSNQNRWADVMAALPDSVRSAYALRYPPAQDDEYNSAVDNETAADSRAATREADRAGLSGPARFDFIGGAIAYGALEGEPRRSAGETLSNYWTTDDCGPAHSRQYTEFDGERPRWAYEVGGGAVGSVMSRSAGSTGAGMPAHSRDSGQGLGPVGTAGTRQAHARVVAAAGARR